MLPTRRTIALSQFRQSEIPYFAAAYGPLIAIAGGGGDAKTGVGNRVEVYQNDIGLTSYDFGDEATFFVYPHDDMLFTAGEKHLSKLYLVRDGDRVSLYLSAYIAISSPSGLSVWKNKVVLAAGQSVYVYDFELVKTAYFYINEEIRGISVNQYAEELFVAVLSASSSCLLSTGLTYYERSPGSIYTNKYALYFKQIEFLDDRHFLASRRGAAEVCVLDGEMEVVRRVPTRRPVAVFRYSAQERLLFAVSVDGLLQVFGQRPGCYFSQICRKQLEATAFISDFQFYSESMQFLCVSVDGWQRGRILQLSYTKYYAFAALALLAFFLGLQGRVPAL